jgi:superfamily I DNA and RNA helicase
MEMDIILDWMKEMVENERLNYSDILVIYPAKRKNSFNLEKVLLPNLEMNNIPYDWITRDRFSKSLFDLGQNSVKISTIQSAKGMDFEAVAVIACDTIKDEQTETYLYVSATRARKYLMMTSGEPNHKVEKILDYAIVNVD